MGRSSFGRLFTANSYNRNSSVKLGTSVTEGRPETGVCGQGLSYVFAAPPIKYFVIFLRLSIANPNPNPNLKP